MKVIIAGGRDIEDFDCLLEAIKEAKFEIEEVVCGMAIGVDLMGRAWAETYEVPVKEFPADWDTHGRSAGPIRNAQMAKYGDALIAIWDGKSAGTKNMIHTMKKLGKPVYIHTVK